MIRSQPPAPVQQWAAKAKAKEAVKGAVKEVVKEAKVKEVVKEIVVKAARVVVKVVRGVVKAGRGVVKAAKEKVAKVAKGKGSNAWTTNPTKTGSRRRDGRKNSEVLSPTEMICMAKWMSSWKAETKCP